MSSPPAPPHARRARAHGRPRHAPAAALVAARQAGAARRRRAAHRAHPSRARVARRPRGDRQPASPSGDDRRGRGRRRRVRRPRALLVGTAAARIGRRAGAAFSLVDGRRAADRERRHPDRSRPARRCTRPTPHRTPSSRWRSSRTRRRCSTAACRSSLRGGRAVHAPRVMRRPGWHFVGVQVASARGVRRRAADAPSESVERHLSRADAARPGSVRGWIATRGFDDIGTPATTRHLPQAERARPAPADRERRAGGRGRPPVEHGLLAGVRWWRTMSAGLVHRVQRRRAWRAGSRYHRSVLLPAGCGSRRPHDYREGALTVSPIDS